MKQKFLLRKVMLRKIMKNPAASPVSAYSTSTDSKKLSGKVAVVTASTDGIGFAISKSLAENGASVVISSRKEKNVNSAVERLQAMGLKNVVGVVCHVANADHRTNLFDKAVKTFGGVDILVSNAAANPSVGPVLDCEESVWDKIFEINVKSSFLLAKQAVPLMRKRGGGSIVFVSSIAAYQTFQMLGVYSISKTALLGLTRAAAQDLAVENIRVNCVAPGIIQTKFSAALTESPARDHLQSLIPMNRFGQSDEIGGVVSFLCSQDASYITGETIVVAGGMFAKL